MANKKRKVSQRSKTHQKLVKKERKRRVRTGRKPGNGGARRRRKAKSKK